MKQLEEGQTQTKQKGNRNNLFLRGGTEPLHIEHENVRVLLERIEAGASAKVEFSTMAKRISLDPDLQLFISRLIKNDPNLIKDFDGLSGAIRFYEKHPTWWEQNVESFFEKMSDRARAGTLEGIDRTLFDVETGVLKGGYSFGKGTVTSVWDILKFLYKINFDEEYQVNFATTLGDWTVKWFKIYFGTTEEATKGAQEIFDFTSQVFSAFSEKIRADWREATEQGKRDELISKWTTLGILEVATFAIAAAKVGKVVRGAGALEEGVGAGNLLGEGANAVDTANEAKKAGQVLKEVVETTKVPIKSRVEIAKEFLATLSEGEREELLFRLRRKMMEGVRELLACEPLARQENKVAAEAWKVAFEKPSFRKYAPLNQLRSAYDGEVSNLAKVAESLLGSGHSEEQVAREVTLLRRQIGVKYKFATKPIERPAIYVSNNRVYNDPLGPSVEFLRKSGKSWRQIIDSSSSANKIINKKLGVP